LRWDAICERASKLGVHIRPELPFNSKASIRRLELDIPSPSNSWPGKHSFTALFAYNDIAAIGAIWAFHEAGLRVPEDISVVGFDDIPGAAYANPGLTTCQAATREGWANRGADCRRSHRGTRRIRA